MPVLPVPMIIALVLSGFLVARFARKETHVSLLALIAVCAVQAAIIALVQYYGFASLRPLQALMATVIPPVAWLAFDEASKSDGRSGHAAWQFATPAFALFVLATKPSLLDILIPAVFTVYGFAMLLRMRGGEDSLPHSRLESGINALMAWRIIALSLIASAGCDLLISYAMASGRTGLFMWLPSLLSSASLLSLGILSLSSAIESRRETDVDEAVPSPVEIERDAVILAKLDSHLMEQKAYLNPDLTLARLARRLSVPAKQLSSAINRGRNENVSRYINRLRIEEACALIREGKSVTAAMFEAGFNTKSNFNREFLRIKGKSPSRWLSEDAAVSPISRPPSSPIA